MLQVRNIEKIYRTGDLIQKALDDVTLSFRDYEFVAILGPSGSGKTTLLNIIGGLDRYDKGDLIINGVTTKNYKDKDWDSYRNHTIGFIFQSYNLISHQSILSNVELALTISNVSKGERRKRAIEALEKVGLKDHIHKKPNQLSGGQMQRVAIARALVNNPDIILADEPTGALDSKTSIQVMDLLKEVAKDRLVIMVTHNPELAEQYATRIVNLKDGKIISDSQPLNNEELETVSKKTPKTKLKFLTALNLSLNNLFTKKGRTILTSFAGAIGIIGIALILSLSNGVNEYIRSVESDMLGSYPIQLQSQTIDMESMMAEGESTTRTKMEERINNTDEKIYVNRIVGDTVKASNSMIIENNLEAFKQYLDKHEVDIDEHINSIEYRYNVTPQVYRLDDKEGVIKVSPASLYRSNQDSSTSMMGLTINAGLSTSWAQMVSSQKLRDQQYDLLVGNWPQAYNEVVLIINSFNEITDYTLYTLGLLDISEMSDIIEAAQNDKEFDHSAIQLDYKEAIGREYQVFSRAQLYKKSENVYVDKAKDEDFLKSHLDQGLTVKVVGVLKAKEDAEIRSGVGYTADLTDYIIDLTASTEVVKDQMAHPNMNIFTNEPFEKEDKKEKSENKTEKTASTSAYILQLLENEEENPEELPGENEGEGEGPEIIPDPTTYTVSFVYEDGTVISQQTYKPDETLTNLPSNNPSKADTETSQFIFVGWMDQDNNFLLTRMLPTTVTKDMTFTAVFVEIPLGLVDNIPSREELVAYFNKILNGEIDITQWISQEELQNIINEIINNLAPDIDISNILSPEKINELIMQYIGEINILDYLTEEQLAQIIQYYMDNFAGQIDMDQYVQAYLEQYLSQLGQNFDMEAYMQQYMEQYMSQMQGALFDSLSQEQLEAILGQYSNSNPKTYDDVLSALGYTTKSNPSSISLYPVDFDSKEVVIDFISQYNKQIDNEDDYVTYTDIIGTLTKRITDIVDTISYILIAFVAISLVVSSIMIAIITYISVLERTKEIGVLRALGASKNDVSKIFNAETFIEGFMSGLIGIIVTLLLNIPINKIVLQLTDVPNISKLPMKYSIILILISIILTLLAGYLPSRVAAKKDPVKALRTE